MLQFVNSILLKSSDRSSNYNLNDFVLNMNTNTSGYDYIGVFSFQMTNNIYPVGQYNNALRVTNGPNTVDILIPYGDYTAQQLITQLEASLNASGLPGTFDVTYSSTSSKITITVPTPGITLSDTFTRVIGMTNPQTDAGSSIVSTYPINIKYSAFLSLISNTLTQFNPPNIRSDLKAGHILHNIPINQYNFGDTIYMEPRNMALFKYDRNYVINSIDLSMRDEFGNLADLNNSEYEIILYGFIDTTFDKI